MSDLTSWSIALPEPFVEPTPRWIRVRAGDTTIADSRNAMLLSWYGPGRLPTYFLPAHHVRTELFTPSAATDQPDHFVYFDVHAKGQVLERSAMQLRDPRGDRAVLEDHWTFTWDGDLTWFEEAAQVYVHARDPHKRVDAMPSDRHVRVERDGVVIAESDRTHALFENPLPPRWYFPMDDVRSGLLVPADTVTRCPYKGTASYWSVRAGDRLHRDLAWSYPDPIPECPRIAGLVAFFNERVDLTIDGVPQERPRTPWSH